MIRVWPSLATTHPGRRPRGVVSVTIASLLAVVAVVAFLFAERHQAPIPDTPEQTRAKVLAAQSFTNHQAAEMLAAYQQHTGRYPATVEGTWALAEAPPRVNGWSGPYLKDQPLPIDPWGQVYHYAYPGTHNGPDKYDIWSLGPDQLSGTADDIGNW